MINARFRVRDVSPGETVDKTLYRLTADHAEDAPGVAVTIEGEVDDLFVRGAQVYVQVLPSGSDMPD